MKNFEVKTALTLSTAALLAFMVTPAEAAPVKGQAFASDLNPSVASSIARPATRGVSLVDFDVTGIESWDSIDSPNNTIATLDIGAALGAPGSEVVITGIAWDVIQSSIGLSWGSEMRVLLQDEISLAPSGTGAPVTSEANSSGGVVVLADIPLDDIVLADGILTMQFFESYDDIADSVDGIWDSGTLSFEAMVVPEPASLALLALGGVLVTRRRR